jgi:hypothetical protein
MWIVDQTISNKEFFYRLNPIDELEYLEVQLPAPEIINLHQRP